MHRTFPKLFLLSALAFFMTMSLSSFSQSPTHPKKVKITVTETVDGVTTTKTEVIDVDAETDVEALLKEYGISDRLGDLKEREIVEIEIRKTKPDGERIETDEITIREPEDIRIEKYTYPEIPKANRPLLGVYFSPQMDGAHVESIMENTAAAKVGVQAGDIITMFDGKAINAQNDLRNIIADYNSGDQVTMMVRRGAETLSIDVTLGDWKPGLGEMPNIREFHFDDFNMEDFNFDDLNLEDLGLDLKKLEGAEGMFEGIYNDMFCEPSNSAFLGISPEGGNSERGVKIAEVHPGTAAEEMGLQPGDLITELNGNKVEDFLDLKNALRKSKTGDAVNVKVNRNGSTQSLSGSFKARQGSASPRVKMYKFDGNNMQSIEEKLEEMDFEELGSQLEENKGELMERIREAMARIEEMSGNSFENADSKVVYKIMVVEVDDLSQEEAQRFDLNKENSLALDDFSFSPNPSDGTFNLSFLFMNGGPCTIRILDLSGKEIYRNEENISGRFSQQIDISDQAAGVYILNVSQGEKSFSKKLVIRD